MDHSNRQLHGALLDAELLAFVYLAMTGGQANLFIEEDDEKAKHTGEPVLHERLTCQSPVIAASAEETEKHHAFIQFLTKKSGVDYWGD